MLKKYLSAAAAACFMVISLNVFAEDSAKATTPTAESKTAAPAEAATKKATKKARKHKKTHAEVDGSTAK